MPGGPAVITSWDALPGATLQKLLLGLTAQQLASFFEELKSRPTLGKAALQALAIPSVWQRTEWDQLLNDDRCYSRSGSVAAIAAQNSFLELGAIPNASPATPFQLRTKVYQVGVWSPVATSWTLSIAHGVAIATGAAAVGVNLKDLTVGNPRQSLVTGRQGTQAGAMPGAIIARIAAPASSVVLFNTTGNFLCDLESASDGVAQVSALYVANETVNQVLNYFVWWAEIPNDGSYP